MQLKPNRRYFKSMNKLTRTYHVMSHTGGKKTENSKKYYRSNFTQAAQLMSG